MCGRLALHTIPSQFSSLFPRLDFSNASFSYNVCPTQRLLALRLSVVDSKLELANLRWGLVPAWADDLSIGASMINARCETVEQKPSFRSAFQSRRCVILANGFYEWKKVTPRSKQPYYIHRRDGNLLCFAGLWETWQAPESKAVQTTTILTTQANQVLSPLHHRMPVILDHLSLDDWLQPGGALDLQSLYAPWPAEELNLHCVSAAMNKPSYNQPDCIDPIDVNPTQQRELF